MRIAARERRWVGWTHGRRVASKNRYRHRHKTQNETRAFEIKTRQTRMQQGLDTSYTREIEEKTGQTASARDQGKTRRRTCGRDKDKTKNERWRPKERTKMQAIETKSRRNASDRDQEETTRDRQIETKTITEDHSK